jgi:penicillin-binding protein 1A
MQKRLRDQYNSSAGKIKLTEITEGILYDKNLSHRADEINRQMIFDWKGSYHDSVTVRDSIMPAITTLQAGLLAIDPQSGAVRAWVGAIDFITQPYDQVLARRQLGSVFKPILYALAFEEVCSPAIIWIMILLYFRNIKNGARRILTIPTVVNLHLRELWPDQ